MKKVILKMAVLGTLSFVSTQIHALGFEPLPPSPSGSAYFNCFNANRVMPPMTADDVKGNFGSYNIPPASFPSATVNNTCFVTKSLSEAVAPLPGYTSIGVRSTNIPTSTGAGGNIGTIVDRVWRNAANDTCLFGTRISMNVNDHDLTSPGIQHFAINDIARGGFSGSGTVNVAYTIFNTTAYWAPIFRIGRSYTSVQHRALTYAGGNSQNGIGYLDLPITGLSPNINGVNSPISSTATASAIASEQMADVNSNWVDFTTDVSWADADGSFASLSAVTYIQAACNATDPNAAANSWIKSGAIRLRQTAQENNIFKEIEIDGYAPPGATVP